VRSVERKRGEGQTGTEIDLHSEYWVVPVRRMRSHARRFRLIKVYLRLPLLARALATEHIEITEYTP
jgi:hypothetical protein